MIEILPEHLPWQLTGPAIGACVVAMYGLANQRLGVSGAWLAATVAPLEGWRGDRSRIHFPAALVGGAVLAAALGAGRGTSGYAGLSATLGSGLLLPLLLAAGVALGYGARWAGGCTSGHGIAGCPTGSPDSLAATATFFSVAVVVTVLAAQLSGGAL